MDFERIARETGYTVFTKDYDEVVHVSELYDDSAIASRKMVLDRYAEDRYGYTWFKEKDIKEWQESLADGIANLRKSLMSAISENNVDTSDLVLSFAVNMSGSLRDLRAIYPRAFTAMSKLFEEFGIQHEVIGFTSVGWKGSDPRQRWLDAGRPFDPGRLNALRMITFKSVDDIVTEGFEGLYAMSDERLYKEDIEGEALALQATELSEMPHSMKAMIYVSDGDASVDDSTCGSNRREILSIYREAVINEILASDINLIQVLASPSERIEEPRTAMLRFGGYTVRPHEFIGSVASAVTHAIGLQASLKSDRKPQSVKDAPTL
jgi:cobaltochelatase CobT